MIFEGASCRCAQCTGPVMCEEDFSMYCFFSWQAQFLVMLEDDSSARCSAFHVWGRLRMFFFVADAMFGDIGG